MVGVLLEGWGGFRSQDEYAAVGSTGFAAAVEARESEPACGAASIWEVAIKQALGKLRAPAGSVAASESLGFSVLPLTGADAERAGALPMHHRDPFDRMLVAQASRLDATIVSRDEAFAAYGVNVTRA